jgi:hypothetical protein
MEITNEFSIMAGGGFSVLLSTLVYFFRSMHQDFRKVQQDVQEIKTSIETIKVGMQAAEELIDLRLSSVEAAVHKNASRSTRKSAAAI